ncbi:hypothetical protein ABL78_4782 [Leptomonas seymouri]|uniref:Uncharacterized protein n=1 Tax=Leptomonas seymouri TaxID=5684 RepID=A0A0N1I4F1_LEPSE|nr:hypothetical protein ABL78_4782 [Leptomonas seymouri]|eukprot:KPI86160.1 hypothetical protein ABL78_4782 [Leptomonas seymouri]
MANPSTTAVVVPTFATITLTFSESGKPAELGPASLGGSGAIESKTMRVPITPQTTIRELAKGAMARYIFSLRRSAKSSDLVARQLCRTGIVVTDVHLLSVTGTTQLENVPDGSLTTQGNASRLPPCRIELFSDDCVMQVVQVRNEVVYMRFRAATESSRKIKSAQLEAATAANSSKRARKDTTEGDSIRMGSSQLAHSEVQQVPSARNGTVMAAENSVASPLTTDDDDVCVNRAAEEASKGEISMSMPLPLLGPAAAALNDGANAFETTHQALTRPNARRSPTSPSRTSSEEDDGDDDGTSASSESDDSEEEQQNIARSIATLRQDETRRMPWGPDAYKHFATNYVNSPQKIMTGRYSCFKRQRRPPSVRLQPHQTARETPGFSTDNGATRDMHNPAKEPPPKPNTEVKAVGVDPLKVSSMEEVSSCDHSQVSVVLSCDTRSPSTTPNARAVSATRIRTLPSGSAAGAMSMTATTDSVPVNAITEKPRGEHTEYKNSEGQEQIEHVTQVQVEPVPLTSTTPADTLNGFTVYPADPSTVAKPVQGLVARQLRFDEECEAGRSEAPTQKDTLFDTVAQAVRVLSVQQVSPHA